MDPIWTYTDYRRWLGDWLSEAKVRRPSVVSSRWMAIQLAMDPSLTSKILACERHLSHSRIQGVCDLTGLVDDEAEYFRQMVHYAKAKGHREAQVCFQKMVVLRKVSPLRLGSRQSAYWERWENVALRELLACGDFGDEWERLGDLLRPRVAPRRVREAMDTLQELGLAARNADGFWRQSTPFLRDGETVDPVSIRHFHKQSLRLAAESIESVPPTERDISALTISIPPEKYGLLVEAIREFRSKVLSLVSSLDKPGQVYQLGIQLVPKSQPESTEVWP